MLYNYRSAADKNLNRSFKTELSRNLIDFTSLAEKFIFCQPKQLCKLYCLVTDDTKGKQ